MYRSPSYSVFAIGLAVVIPSCQQERAPKARGVAAPS